MKVHMQMKSSGIARSMLTVRSWVRAYIGMKRLRNARMDESTLASWRIAWTVYTIIPNYLYRDGGGAHRGIWASTFKQTSLGLV